MTSVTATKKRNIKSGVDTSLLLLPRRVQTLDDAARSLVPAARGAHVEGGHGPRHEELREREEVGEVDAEHARVHQPRRVANQHGEREVVDDEEDGRRHDEAALR